MKEIKISDVTMKQMVKDNTFSLTFKEKIELAKLLDKLGVSVIELEGITRDKVDMLRIKSIASAVKNSVVAVPVELSEKSVASTAAALVEARHPRLQVPAAVSSVQMEYLYHKKPAAMLEAVSKTVAAACEKCSDVEFIAVDVTRSDPAFACKAIKAALDAGATTVTLCDAAGNMLPDEFAGFIRSIIEEVPELKEVNLGICASNELSMADACAIAAVREGVTELKCTSFPTNTVSLANAAKVIAGKGDLWGVTCGIRVTEMGRILSQIGRMCRTDRSSTSPFDTGVQEDEQLYLNVNDTLPNVVKAAVSLGHDLSEDDAVKVYEAFLRIATKKDEVSYKELDAIIASVALQVPPAYTIDSYVINSGNVISATAHMKLIRDGKVYESASVGDGSIDASFLAIEQITGRHFELDDFQIRAVTEGREAMGETVVKLRSEGRVYSGRGISTDIVGSSILAYVNALNKIIYEEESR